MCALIIRFLRVGLQTAHPCLPLFILSGLLFPALANALDLTRYLPLTTGNQWIYRNNNNTTQTQTVGDPVVLPGGVSAVPWASADSGATGNTVTYCAVDGNGFRWYQENLNNVFVPGKGNTTGTSTYSPAMAIAPANVTVGSTYTSTGKMPATYTVTTTNMIATVTSTFSYSASTQIMGFETVTNYDGTQSWSALKVLSTMVYDNPDMHKSIATTYWLVDGIGAIQIYKPNLSGVMETWKLVSYYSPISVSAQVSLSPASLTFTGQNVGVTSAAQTATLTNSGTTALSITGITASGDFAQTNNCGASIAAGASCTLTITSMPTVAGVITGTITITSDTASSPSLGVTSVPAGTLNFVSGWNLAGNSVNAQLNVANTLGDANKVTTVWKWVPATSKWAFYTPLQADGGAAYAATKGYDALTTINGGEGFWVNAKTAFTAQMPVGTTIGTSYFQNQTDTTRNKLAKGWNLVATGDDVTPSAFNKAINVTPLAMGVIPINITTLWAWDSTQMGWYFYAPSLEANGTLANYITSKNYLDFTANGKMLGQGVGFWVNRP